MNPPAGWTISPFPFRWDLLFNFDDLSGSGRWYRMTGSGDVTAMAFAEGASYCVISPGGARALLIGNSSFYEGTHGLWTILRSVVDLRSDSTAGAKIAIGCWPAWSNDEMRFAYFRATEAWSNEERRVVSCRKDEGESHPGGGDLAVQDLGSDSVRETPTRRIQCLRWRPDDREIIAVVRDRRGLSVMTFTPDELVQVSESALPVEPTAQGISISPNAEYVSFCDFPSGDDSPDDAPYSGYIYGLTDGRMLPIGPQCLDTQPKWSPTGRWLACRDCKDAGRDSHQMVAITDPAVGETIEIARVNSDDLSGDITGPDPAWSLDGGLLAFVSFEKGGSAIYITDVSSGTCAKVLQTEGLVHSLGFVRTS
jgi:dipeptidyl aminopeptidase/acylaminoacyl peptidase